jgi:hypothetical protein
MDRGPQDRPGLLRTWGPLAAVLAALAAVAVLVLAGDGTGTGSAGGATATTALPPGEGLPEEVLPFSVAEERGVADEIDWGPTCDPTTGVLRLPLSPAPQCFAPFTGDNGGASATGVTGDAIRVVVYLPQRNDPILSFIYRQIGNTDTPDKVFATYQGFNEILDRYYETYGRTVELVPYEATGNISDPVAAAADAETIARDLQPFAVVGGPLLTEAFSDTLAANRVLCISCGPGQPTSWYEERAPYVWDIAKNPQQNLMLVAEYVVKRLGGRPAVYGGEGVRGRERRLGYVYLSSTPQTEQLRRGFEAQLEEGGVELAETASYEDPVAIAARAGEIMARFRDAGITTVLYTGDPLAPQALTRAATEQGFFPEWVITGSSLVDTTIFGRTYDEQQWRRAFGPSNLFARVSPEVAGSGYLYRWWHGEPPPAQQSALILPNLQLLYAVLQGAGTELSPEQFRRTIFAADIVRGSVIAPQISWGNRGIFPGTDYSGLDDQTEVWWDPDVTCPDEIGNEGRGCWSYAEGGRRYLPGQWTREQPRLFDRARNSVTLYTDLPPGITLPDYEPLR